MKSDHRYHFKKKMCYLCPMRPEIKNRRRRRSLFRGSKSRERNIDNLTLYPPSPLYSYLTFVGNLVNIQDTEFGNLQTSCSNILPSTQTETSSILSSLPVKIKVSLLIIKVDIYSRPLLFINTGSNSKLNNLISSGLSFIRLNPKT